MSTDLGVGTGMSQPSVPQTHAMGAERQKLRKTLRQVDAVFITIAALVVFDTIAVTASVGGGQSLLWMVLLIVVYLLPYGLIVSELGSTFPYEGGAYAWPRLAYGRLAGAYTSVFYWLSNPVWVGSTVAAVVVATINSLVVPNHHLGTWASVLVGVGVVCSVTIVSWIELRWGKWAGAIGTVVRLLALAMFLALVVTFLVQHGKPAGTLTMGDMKPSIAGFLGVIGLLQFLFVGFEIPSNAGEEMTNPQRDVPRMILRSGVAAVLVYAAILLGVLLVIPGTGLSKVAGFTDAYAAVAGVLGGATHTVNYVLAALVILSMISAGSVWQQGTCRAQAVAALDGSAPLWLGRFSAQGTPVTMNILSTIIGSAFVACIFLISKGSLAVFFSLTVSVTISLTAMMYFFVFPSVIRLRKLYPDRQRPFRVPGGKVGLWICVIGSEFIIVLTTVTLLFPGLLNAVFGQSYSIETSWGVSRTYFESVSLGIVAFFFLIAGVFLYLGSRNRKKGLVGEDDLLTLKIEAAQPAPSAGTGRDR